MKTSVLFITLLTAAPLFAQQPVSPEKKYEIVRREFDESLREKIRVRHPYTSPLGETSPILSASEVLVSQDNNAESELHAAISPTGNGNMVVGAMSMTDIFLLSFPIYYSENSGASWQLSSFSGESPVPDGFRQGGGDPMFAYSLDGKDLFYTFIDVAANSFASDTLSETIWLAHSTDGGKSFSVSKDAFLASGVTVIDSLFIFNGALPDKEWMTIDRSQSAKRGTIYASYVLIDEKDTLITLHVRSIPPGGSMFSDRNTVVPTKGMLYVQIATIDVDASGNIHLSFIGSTDFFTYFIFHSVSTDGGMTFSKPQVISQAELARRSLTSFGTYVPGIDSGRQIPSVQIACGRSANAGEVYCIWEALGTTHATASGEDIYFSRSTDNGASWSSPMIVNQDKREYRHQFRPSMFVTDNGTIVAGWYDGRTAADNTSVDYYVSFSTDGGRTFTGETKVSGTPTDFSTVEQKQLGFGIGEYLQILAQGNTIHPIWTDGRTDDGSLKIYSAAVPMSSSASVSENLSILNNPVTDRSTISFTLSDSTSDIDLSLYDVIGRKIETLYHGISPAKQNQMLFTADNIAAGIYFVTMKTNTSVITKKLANLK